MKESKRQRGTTLRIQLKLTWKCIKGLRVWPAKLTHLSQWRWLLPNLACHHDHYKLELPRVWELLGSSGTYQLGKNKGPTILFLMETKLTVNEMQTIKTELDFPSMLCVPNVRRSGGLALLWKNYVVVTTQTYSPNHIDAFVYSPMQALWRLTGMYGHLEERLKSETWRLMRHLRAQASLPWLCLGDFNEIMCFKERKSRTPKPLQPMLEFQNTLLHCGLVDLGFQGYKYTRRNGRHEEAFMEQQLDRVCALKEWQELYPQMKVIHAIATYSDHNPIVLNTEPTQMRQRRKRKIHRFEEKWTAHIECEDRVRSSWLQH